MGLTLVTGAANSGKTGVLHSAVRESLSTGRAPLLLLPSRPEVDRAESEFAREGVSLGLTVAQFDGYLDQLWGLIGDGRVIVRRTQRLLMIDEIIGAARLDVLTRSSSRPGFARLVESLVMRAAEGSALDGERAGAADSPLASELLGLVDAYAKRLMEQGLVEPSEAHQLLSATIRPEDLPEFIAINRFANFTVAQRSFIDRCAVLGADLMIAITWVDGHPATATASTVIRDLQALPGAVHRPIDTPAGGGELDRVAQKLFRGERSAFGVPGGAVTLSEAAGTAGEAARIVREVQEMAKSGIQYDDIAVVFRSPERHIARLAAAFNESAIPVELDARIPATSTGIGRAIILLLGHLCGGRGRHELMGFLRSGYAWAEPGEVDRLDAALRRSRIESGGVVYDKALRVGAKTRLLLERADRLAGARIDAAAVEGWRWLVADMLRSAYQDGMILDDTGLLDAAAQGTIMAAIQEIAALRDSGAGARELLSVLAGAQVTLTPDATRGNRVHVMSAERARSRRFSAVILGGLNSGEFPAIPADDALSSPRLVAELGAAGIDVSSRIDTDAERLLFYQVITGARERLVLSRMVCDDDGRPTRPSPLWEEFLDLYRDPVSGQSHTGADVPVRRLQLSDLTEAEDAPMAERRTLRAGAAGEGGGNRVDAARWRARERSTCLDDGIRSKLAARDVFSASEIEAYLACPFHWYYDRMLGAEALDEEIGALAKGRLAHEILNRFYEQRAATRRGRVTAENLRTALSEHGKLAAEVVKSGPAPGTLQEEEVIRAAIVGSERIIRQDALFMPGFTPCATELAFGMGEEDPPVKIGSFFLKGRIDRIDSSSSGIVVIDYKTGSTVAKKADFDKRGLVQLPLYGHAASEKLGAPLLGGLYRSMQYGGDRGFYRAGVSGMEGLSRNDACDEVGFEQVIASAIQRAETAVAGIRAGDIPARARDKDACAYCGAASVCGGRLS